MTHIVIGAWCAFFGLCFYYGTTGDSGGAIVWGGAGMAFSAYQLALIAVKHKP